MTDVGHERPIAVIGGTGMLGMPVVHRLVEEGHAVRVLSRDPVAARRKLGGEAIEHLRADVDDEASLAEALAGCGGVHVSLMGGPRPDDFDRVEHLGTARVARVAATLGLSRLTYLSGAPAVRGNERDPGSRAKLLASEAIQASGVPYTIFRATWMMEALEMFIRGKNALVLGTQSHPVRWIAADDFARAVAASFRRPETADQTYFLVGPESLTKPEALSVYISRVRPDLKLRRVPLRLMRAVARASFDPQLRSDVSRMRFYDGIGDDFGDPTEADRVFGPARTTLAAWCDERHSRQP